MSNVPMCPVIHFHMPYRDGKRAAGFYAAAFGWKYEQLGPEMGNYIVVTTATKDARPGAPGGSIDGGLYQFNPDMPDQVAGIVVGVEDIHAAIDRIRAAGGQVPGQPSMIPGVGDFVGFIDTEGNHHAVLQPLPRAK